MLKSSSSRTEQHNHHLKFCFCCRKSNTEEGRTVEASDNDGKEGDQDHELDREEEENMMERAEDANTQPRLISEGGVINSIMITRSFDIIYSSSHSCCFFRSMAVPPVSGLADRALEVLMGRSGRESRDLTEQEWAERIEQERRRVAVVEAERVRVARRAQLDLFDLSDNGTEQREDEPAEGSEQETSDRHLEALPPSYSHAEGLDQLPDYSAAEVHLTSHNSNNNSCAYFSGEQSEDWSLCHGL